MKKTSKEDRSKDFAVEVEDLLEILGRGLLQLEKCFTEGRVDHVLINGIFRSAHTLKGICGVYDFNEMIRLSHAIENCLDSIRLGRLSLTDELLDALLRAHDLMFKMAGSGDGAGFTRELKSVEGVLKKSGKARESRRKEDHVDRELLDVLTEYEEHRLVENIKGEKNILIVEADFHLESFDKEYDNFIKLLQSETELIATLPSKNKVKGEMVRLELLAGTAMDKQALKDFLADKVSGSVNLVHASPKIKGTPGFLWQGKGPAEADENAPKPLGMATNTVRVDISKLDSAMNIVGELALLKSSFSMLSREIRQELPYSEAGRESLRLEKHLERKLTELKDSLLDIRMVQIGQLFSRYETLLTRLSRKTGKQVRMVTSGVETELDKLMVEQLSDPVMHIIRNVVDHAIEPPKEREKLGKDPIGTITLSAFQKGNRVVVEIEDDGRGIDADSIRERAVQKGLLSSEAVEGLSERELLDLIFIPGFTTKDYVSEVSGRGVGLDVVKENIASLSGVIDIKTEKGKGTKFVFTIPITLAIVQVIIVEDSGDRYALPLNAVTEVVTVDATEVTGAAVGTAIKIDDRQLACVRLSAFMGKKPGNGSDRLNCIVSGIAEHRFGIAVDRIVEQLDLVIKPLAGPIKVPGIAGAADLSMDGDKGTVLVLDVSGIMETVQKERKGIKAERLSAEGLYSEGLH